MGARMNRQVANQVGVVEGKVLDNGSAGREAERVHQPAKFISNHRVVIIRHVLHGVACQ